jgi:hypothetical protein
MRRRNLARESGRAAKMLGVEGCRIPFRAGASGAIRITKLNPG